MAKGIEFYVERIEGKKTEITFQTEDKELVYERFADNLKCKYIWKVPYIGRVERKNYYDGYCKYTFTIKSTCDKNVKWRYVFIIKE